MIDNLIGKTLGEYQIVALASRDGIATVYKAYQPSTKRYVALKVSPAGAAQDAEFVKRFRPEALAASRVKHPNLLVIYDAGQEGNLFYIAREYVEGQTLAQLVQRTGGLDTLRAAQIFAQIATALDVAHQRGLIHGDIKPDNILIGPNDQVKLTDLGIVKALAGAGAQIAGAPEYMSPEQIQGRPVDRRSDLYSLGVVLYQMLTGNVPFSGNTPQAIMDAHVNRAPTPPSRLTAFVTHPVDAVVMRALAKNPAERFASAQEMSVALSQAAVGLYAEATIPVPAPATPPAAPRSSRSALVPIVAGLGILALIAISVIIVISVIILGIARMNAARGIVAQVTSSATPAPAATATPMPTLTLTPSPVQPTPAASIPPLTPTSTPSPTRVEPTATPSPPPTATASTTQVSLAATATARPGVLLDFETMGSWRRGDQSNGTLVQSTQHAHTGQASARLDYSFPTGSNDFVVFINPVTLYGQPNVISVWVYGDGSGHFLNAWIMDSGSQVWQVPLGRVGGAGWKQMAGSIATGQAWPWAHISGPDNGQVDYPISFYALVLDDNPDTFVGSGTIYLDDVTVGRTDSIPTSVARATTPPRTTPSVTTAANEPRGVTPYSPINGTQFRSSVITFKWSGGALQSGETFVIEIIPTQVNKSGCTADYGQAGLQYSPPLADHEWTTDINANPPPGKARPCPGRIEWRVHIRDAAGSVIQSTPHNYFEWNPL